MRTSSGLGFGSPPKKKATRRKLIPNRGATVLDEANVTKIGTFGDSDRAREVRGETVNGETVKFPFRRDGFLHELIAKVGPVCLVRRSKENRQIHFEVVVLQWSKGRTWPSGRISPDGWHYPSSEQWGTYGWTYRDFAEARAKYHSLPLKWPEKLQAWGKNGDQNRREGRAADPPIKRAVANSARKEVSAGGHSMEQPQRPICAR